MSLSFKISPLASTPGKLLLTLVKQSRICPHHSRKVAFREVPEADFASNPQAFIASLTSELALKPNCFTKHTLSLLDRAASALSGKIQSNKDSSFLGVQIGLASQAIQVVYPKDLFLAVENILNKAEIGFKEIHHVTSISDGTFEVVFTNTFGGIQILHVH
jgi:hypothetical protein